jgi:hypothetical protein
MVRSNPIILTHLGESVPPYLEDCVKQIRLWNPLAVIYIILDDCHKGQEFFTNLDDEYGVRLVFRSTLEQTPEHKYFLQNFKGDLVFRKGYWRHVKERFFLIQELMMKEDLTNVLAMEYDVLLYINIDSMIKELKDTKTMRMVRDNDQRAHPAFLFIPTVESIKRFNNFLLSIIQSPLEDMQSLAAYADHSGAMKYFPVITEERNRSIKKRTSTQGHTSENPFYLSDEFSRFNMLFDSLTVGQWVGGIDSRNTGGHRVARYENESALYNINEMSFTWKKNPETFLWQPYLDGILLATIHVHCKALSCFMSDRPDFPKDDYDVKEVNGGLLPN